MRQKAPSVTDFARLVNAQLVAIGIDNVSPVIVREIIATAHSVSMRTEEGRPVRCALTYADPKQPDPESPSKMRAAYPTFTKFSRLYDFTSERIAKLSRAIDSWSGSLAVFRLGKSGLQIWGFVDQRVHFNLELNSESRGFGQPGLVTIVIDGIGQLSAYHDRFFLGSLRIDEIYTTQSPAFSTKAVLDKVKRHVAPTIGHILRNLPLDEKRRDVVYHYAITWNETIRRICIGVQRAGTGGMLLVSSAPSTHAITGGIECEYTRVGEAIACHTLQVAYFDHVKRRFLNSDAKAHPPFQEYVKAQADVEDRADELTGVVKLVSSVATLDGATVLKPDLSLIRFGAKVNSSTDLGTVFNASMIGADGRFTEFDYSKHGTRHLSALRYCREDPNSFAVVISQDGAIRVVSTIRGQLLVYDNIQLREYDTDPVNEVESRAEVLEWKHKLGQTYGYTTLPKSIASLEAGSHASRSLLSTNAANSAKS